MAKLNKKQEAEGKETVEIFQDLDRSAVSAEKFVEKNFKKLGIVLGVLVAGILGYFAYKHFVVAPKNNEATMAYLAAQKALAEGKDDVALGGKSKANPGFKGIAQEFSGTEAGKLAAYNAGLLEFKKGNYQKAYDLLDQFSSNNKILMALKYGAMGDSMANLNKNDDALAQFEKAITASDDAYTSYYFTRKAGLMAIALKKKDVAKKHFTTIEDKFKDYDGGASDAYIEMVKYY